MSAIDQIRKDWDDLAQINAAWFNLPSDHLSKDPDAFFRSGKSHLKKDLELINLLRIALNKGVALDFGCGIGRITQALAEEFETAYGVDISEEMIAVAKRHNHFHGRCQYIANPRPDLRLFKDRLFDFILSTNVLQHNPPDVTTNYLVEFMRTLRPAGVLILQMPIERLTEDLSGAYLRGLPKLHPKRIWNKSRGMLIGHDNAARYYKLRKIGLSKRWLNEKLGLHPKISMHSMEENAVREIIESQGGFVRHVERYPYEDMLHADFVVVKPA